MYHVEITLYYKNKACNFFLAEYDPGQQIVLGGPASQPLPMLPTHVDVLAAFPTWQNQAALFVPER